MTSKKRNAESEPSGRVPAHARALARLAVARKRPAFRRADEALASLDASQIMGIALRALAASQDGDVIRWIRERPHRGLGLRLESNLAGFHDHEMLYLMALFFAGLGQDEMAMLLIVEAAYAQGRGEALAASSSTRDRIRAAAMRAVEAKQARTDLKMDPAWREACRLMSKGEAPHLIIGKVRLKTRICESTLRYHLSDFLANYRAWRDAESKKKPTTTPVLAA